MMMMLMMGRDFEKSEYSSSSCLYIAKVQIERVEFSMHGRKAMVLTAWNIDARVFVPCQFSCRLGTVVAICVCTHIST